MGRQKPNNQNRIATVQRRAEIANRRFKENRRQRNIAKSGNPNNLRRFKTGGYPKQLKYRLITIHAPVVFSFQRNTQEMCEFVSNIQDRYNKKKGVFIAMERVKSIDYDAIVILLSVMIKFQEDSINFNGSYPKDLSARKIVTQSGFIESLYHKNDLGQYILKGRSNRMYTTGWNLVSNDLAEQIMEDITPKLFGEKRTLKGLYRVLIELMHNSHNHANPTMKGTKDWWLSINVHEDKVAFSFIDYGIGVFESLKLKPENYVFKKWLNQVAATIQDNSKIMRKILDGEMHQTSTNAYYRGKGLPAIMEVYNRNSISSLCIITNDVFVSVENNVYKTLDINFNGTFVYWEINKNTITHPWTPLT